MTKDNLIQKMLHYIDLESEIDDVDLIHQSIEKDVIFKGTNLWILIFAIFVASIGLNMNSTAVIIGAMLISPLMGPINGMGYSLATYNYPLFKMAVKNFSFAVIAGLTASTIYFSLSPISAAHSELLARTSPTIYDVLIAIFGGLAGIVAISSKLKGNVIPGVAIATALMPPLCTAGYGIATGQLYYFLGAIYLFTINTVFIGLSAMAISQILKFPIRATVDSAQKKKINRWISIVIIAIVLPSIYFGYILVQKEKFTENATKYVNNISVIDGNYLLKNEINPVKKSITLLYGGPSLSETQKMSIQEKAKYFSLENAEIKFQQGLSFDVITRKNTEVDNLKGELNREYLLLQEKNKQIDSLIKRNYRGREVLDEIKTLYPEVVSCSYGESLVFNDPKSSPENVEIIVFTTKGKNLYNRDKKKIEDWLKTRLKSDSIKVFYEKSK
jgi:uncharacterized hydrophobic protein (TIGR00271 family)